MSSINAHKLKITEKTALIFQVHEASLDPGIVAIKKLILCLLAERREDNDTSTTISSKLNQGEIRGYKLLLDYIEKGIPAQELQDWKNMAVKDYISAQSVTRP